MPRSTNFTDFEKNLLVQLMDNYKKIIECKKTDCVTAAAKNKAWEKLCQAFNAESTNATRNIGQLQVLWKNFKSRAKKESAYVRRERFQTGGGPPPAEDSQLQKVEGINGILYQKVTSTKHTNIPFVVLKSTLCCNSLFKAK